MKVLHVLHELYPSGAEMMLKNAYPYWKDEVQGTIMSTGNILGPFADTLEATGYEVTFVPTVGSGKKAKLKHLWSFFTYMRKHSYDVVHIHRESLSFEYALICKLTGNKKICRTVHSTFAHKGVQRLIKSCTRKLMHGSLGVQYIAISDGVCANEKKVFGIKCDKVIYNWCNNKEFAYIPQLDKTMPKREMLGKCDNALALKSSQILSIVTVGTCADVKNHPLLLDAIAKMEHKEQIHYFHVGYAEGITEEEEKRAEELGISGQATFVGRCDPMPYLKAADVYLMTSKYEGLSIAALEAIFTGMPVLLSDVRGLDEFKDKELSNVDYFAPDATSLAKKLDEYVERLTKGILQPSEEQSQRAEVLYDIVRQVGKYVALYKNFPV